MTSNFIKEPRFEWKGAGMLRWKDPTFVSVVMNQSELWRIFFFHTSKYRNCSKAFTYRSTQHWRDNLNNNSLLCVKLKNTIIIMDAVAGGGAFEVLPGVEVPLGSDDCVVELYNCYWVSLRLLAQGHEKNCSCPIFVMSWTLFFLMSWTLLRNCYLCHAKRTPKDAKLTLKGGILKR